MTQTERKTVALYVLLVLITASAACAALVSGPAQTGVAVAFACFSVATIFFVRQAIRTLVIGQERELARLRPTR